MSYADPSLQLQKAIVAVLKADLDVNAIIAGRIYDAVPGGAIKPYVSFGPFQMLPEHGDCLDGGEAFVTLDGWASGPDSVQVKTLGRAVARALDRAELVLGDGQRLVDMSVEQTQYMRDPDGITAHAVITVHAWTEPTFESGDDIIMSAGRGTFVLTGSAAGLLPSLSMEAGAGIFVLTGRDATLRPPGIQFEMQAEVGAFTLTGNDITTRAAFGMQPAAGAFVLTGISITTGGSLALEAGTGAFALTGLNADLKPPGVQLSMQAQAGAFVLTGNDATLTPPGATLAPIIDLTGVCDKGLSSTDNITNVNTPEFDVICMTTPVVGDTITVAKDGVIVASAVLTADDIAGTTVPSLGTATLADGTYVFTARHTNAGSTSAWSAGLSVTIDTVAPVLTAASGAQNATVPSTVDLSVTTNKGQGIIYWMIQPAAWAAPTVLEIIDYRGTADGLWVDAGRHGSFNVSTAGAKTASATVSVSGSFKVYFTHTDVAGNNAAIPSVSAWTHTMPTFTANGVGGFDGSTTYMTNTGIVAAGGIATGKKGLVSFWVKVLGGAGTARSIFTLSSGTTVKLWCSLIASNVVSINGRQADPAGADILSMQSGSVGTPFTPPPTGWIHVGIWWDLSLGLSGGGIYVNGALNTSGSKTLTDQLLGYDRTTLNVGASQTAATKFNGSLSELYINLHETLDLSNPANLQKFRGSGGAPMSLGATGTNPTGSQPEFYLGDDNTFATWGTNNGSKGNFTTPAGALTSVTGPP